MRTRARAQCCGCCLQTLRTKALEIRLLTTPQNTPRLRLRQSFPVTFYAAGPPARLRQLWRWLRAQPTRLQLTRSERRDLFLAQPLPVLAVQVENPVAQERLFSQVSQVFPELTYYDADINLALRYAAAYSTFPLAHLRLEVDADQHIHQLETLNTPWEMDSDLPALRILEIEPDCDPRRGEPSRLMLRCGRRSCCLSLQPARPMLINLAAFLCQCDPDLILSGWGDTWLLPHLLELAEQTGLPLPLNRDNSREVLRKRAISYFSYGQVNHRGQQVHLFGRWHIDKYNAMLFHDYGLEGVLESARVTGAAVQTSARLSPGSGISAMQIVTALREQVLVPWHKQQAEDLKTASDLIRADQGGLVYQPKVGLHHNVAEIDFISMYPGIMVYFNISPETVGASKEQAVRVPALNLWVDCQSQGLIPRTLQPLLEKRIALKARIAELPAWDPRRARYKAFASAHKWLLVTCFGYLGYKNARFGRIEAHESVTAYSREALLRAKEAAEDLGYTVLHMYVDALWVQKPSCSQVQDVQPLLDEILNRTGLPIALEGIYHWLAFLPSKVNPHIPVANRYFGAFQDGSLKVRGIEARRGDAPPFVAEAQMHILELLVQAADPAQPASQIPQVVAFLRRQVQLLRNGRVAMEKLVVAQKLSRELELYRTPSPPARAAGQLAAAGRQPSPGQLVKFIYTRGEPGVSAWDLSRALDPQAVDSARYRELLLRAAASVLVPFGLDQETLDFYLQEAVNPARLLPPRPRLLRLPHAQNLLP